MEAAFEQDGRPFHLDLTPEAAFQELHEQVTPDEMHETAAPIKAVVIGGGTGAPVSIRTLLTLEAQVCAVVAMADDGGSTGILRRSAGVTTPGDIRKCLVAMADTQDPLTKAFKYRFSFADNHSLGNLMLSALEDATGSFPEAIAVCERILGTAGHVYPSTLGNVTLCAEDKLGNHLQGQATCCSSPVALRRVWLESGDGVVAYQPALDAIREADLIVLGPGSLFTSIIPNLLVPGVVEAIRASKGATVFVCSLADMQGETRGMSALEHYQALCSHGMEGLVDYMLLHCPEVLRPQCPDAVQPADAALPPASAVRPVTTSFEESQIIRESGTVLLVRDLVDPKRPTWHNPTALRDAFRSVVRLSRAL